MHLSQSDFARLCLGSLQRINKIFREWIGRGVLKIQGDKYILCGIPSLEHEVNAQEVENKTHNYESSFIRVSQDGREY